LSCLSLAIVLTAGCASVPGPADPHDPLESYNRAMYRFNRGFDDNVAKPVAKAYQKVTPAWMDKGITNFFSNLDDVVVLFNDLLQLKIAQAASDTARIVFNSTVGLLGFVDVATPMDLPKHNEDFGQTLGYWGMPPGPYFILPFLGPSTIRDSAGLGTDYAFFDPVTNRVPKKTSRNSLLVVDFIDTRADLLKASSLLDEAALDPYIYTREAYLQRRRYFVYDGNPPMEDFDQ
jgi:phospholipid-binding lipoprotein MlaA